MRHARSMSQRSILAASDVTGPVGAVAGSGAALRCSSPLEVVVPLEDKRNEPRSVRRMTARLNRSLQDHLVILVSVDHDLPAQAPALDESEASIEPQRRDVRGADLNHQLAIADA